MIRDMDSVSPATSNNLLGINSLLHKAVLIMNPKASIITSFMFTIINFTSTLTESNAQGINQWRSKLKPQFLQIQPCTLSVFFFFVSPRRLLSETTVEKR